MDFDFRASTIHSSKHLSAVQASRLHHDSQSKPAMKIISNWIEEPNSSLDGIQREKLVTEILRVREAVIIEKVQLSLLEAESQSQLSSDISRSELYKKYLEYMKTDRAAGYLADGRDEDDKMKAMYYLNSDEENCPVFYDSDGDDDSRSYFICPFCYVEIEVPVLCSHLQEEHCFDLKNAVCPLCAANLGKDAIGHFISQHPSSLKRRRKPEKSDSSSANSTVLGKKQATYGRGNKHELTTDPLLSPFIYNLSIPAPNNIHQDEHSTNNATVISDAKSSGTDAQEMGDEQDHQERRQRAGFVQQLVASTIF